jgi:hypothetical protein
MATIAFGTLVVLVLYRSPRAAGWCLTGGALLFALLYAMRRLRTPWPDLGTRTVVLLYLFLTLAGLLTTGGGLAILVRWARGGRPRRPVR